MSAAKQSIGITESAPNVTEFGARFGKNGVSWCAIFVWDCFKNAGFDLKTLTSELASCWEFHHAAVNAGWKKVTPTTASSGDVIFFLWPQDKGIPKHLSHVGLVDEPAGKNSKKIMTIEGNTPPPPGSKSKAEGVYRKERANNDTVYAILRPPYKQDGTDSRTESNETSVYPASVPLIFRFVLRNPMASLNLSGD